jgi:quercetin dioxygenase-like cupin family protein
MRRFVLKRGGVIPKHTKTIEHEQFVLRGQACVGINMDVYTVKVGELVFIPEVCFTGIAGHSPID